MLGKHHTKESNEKNRKKHLGKKWTEDQRKKMKKKMKEKIPWNKGLKQKEIYPHIGFQKNNIPFNKGIKGWKHLGSFKKGKFHPMFNNWSSREPYTKEWDNELKEYIKKRDNYICQILNCQETRKTKKLHVHHIDYNKKNCKEKNLITLCPSCHVKANFNKDYWIKYFKKIIKIKYYEI